jgi:hypothetical protein
MFNNVFMLSVILFVIHHLASRGKSKKSGSIAKHNIQAELTLSRKAGIPRERGVLAETVDAFALRSMASIAISSEEKPARGVASWSLASGASHSSR